MVWCVCVCVVLVCICVSVRCVCTVYCMCWCVSVWCVYVLSVYCVCGMWYVCLCMCVLCGMCTYCVLYVLWVGVHTVICGSIHSWYTWEMKEYSLKCSAHLSTRPLSIALLVCSYNDIHSDIITIFIVVMVCWVGDCLGCLPTSTHLLWFCAADEAIT